MVNDFEILGGGCHAQPWLCPSTRTLKTIGLRLISTSVINCLGLLALQHLASEAVLPGINNGRDLVIDSLSRGNKYPDGNWVYKASLSSP
jgi:hypothetical protein